MIFYEHWQICEQIQRYRNPKLLMLMLSLLVPH